MLGGAGFLPSTVGFITSGNSLKLTAKAPENRPKPNRKGSSSNHPFSGANCSFQGGYPFIFGHFVGVVCPFITGEGAHLVGLPRCCNEV